MSCIIKTLEAESVNELSALVDDYLANWHPAGYGTTVRTIGTKWAEQVEGVKGRKKLFFATIDRYSSCS